MHIIISNILCTINNHICLCKVMIYEFKKYLRTGIYLIKFYKLIFIQKQCFEVNNIHIVNNYII